MKLYRISIMSKAGFLVSMAVCLGSFSSALEAQGITHPIVDTRQTQCYGAESKTS